MTLEEIDVRLHLLPEPHKRGKLLHDALTLCEASSDSLRWRYYKALLEQLQQEQLQRRRGSVFLRYRASSVFL